MTDRRDQAIELFAPLGPRYDRLGALLSFGQDPRWRRAMVSHIPRDGGQRARRRDGHRPRRRAAARAGPPGHRPRPEPRHARGRAEQVRRPRRARRGVGHRDPLRRRLVRPPHVHLPAALRRRSRPRPCAELARVVRPGGTIANLEFCVPAWHLAAALGSLRRRRPPGARPHRVEGLVRRRPLPRPVDSRVLRAVAARAPARALARGRRRRRPGPAHERRRWRRDLGHET